MKKARSVAGSDVDSAMCDSPARSSPDGSPAASPGKRPGGGAAARGAARRRRQRGANWRSVGLYLLPRLAVLLYFGAWLVALPVSGSYSLHLHHYALAWVVAIFAAFNHPISGLVLALATGVFVQVGRPRMPRALGRAWRGEACRLAWVDSSKVQVSGICRQCKAAAAMAPGSVPPLGPGSAPRSPALEGRLPQLATHAPFTSRTSP